LTPTTRPVDRRSTGSAAGALEERQPPRPPNAFILFRAKCIRDSGRSVTSSSPSSADSPSLVDNAREERHRQADLSKTISQQWMALAPAERAPWYALAREKQREHETLYPNYVYRPQRSYTKNRPDAPTSAARPSSAPATPRWTPYAGWIASPASNTSGSDSRPLYTPDPQRYSRPSSAAPLDFSPRQRQPPPEATAQEWRHHAHGHAVLGNLTGPNREQLTSADPYNTTVFVGGLNPRVGRETIRATFAPFGEIQHVRPSFPSLTVSHRYSR
jgi:hypothetical protein